ncbi:MAG: UdgX family uracil-DNA binding protein [Pirellulaceae bacterium]
MSVRIFDFDQWRSQARRYLQSQTPPEEARFVDGWRPQQELGLRFDAADDERQADESTDDAKPNPNLTVSRAFLDLAREVSHHRNPGRWDLLYRMLWRMGHGEPQLLELLTDDDVFRARTWQKQIRRDCHKAKAFVRFRKCERDGETWYVAWHRPDHYILPRVAPFFIDRFRSMRWMILTPDQSIAWDLHELHDSPGVPREAAPSGDELEKLWLTYYGAIFNPARIKLAAMRGEMPVKHWSTLPEAKIIDRLVAEAPDRVAQMLKHQEGWSTTARDFLPAGNDWSSLQQAIQKCEGCPLYRDATQVVFGEGPVDARLMFVGEQPGDEEDLKGRPFVGPAGRLLDEILAEVQIDRAQVYVTNAVKHFKYSQRGKRRLHAKPNRSEVVSCREWLQREFALVRPKVTVCLGATAAESLLGPAIRIGPNLGNVLVSDFCEQTIVTYHPSAVLRAATPQRSTEIRQAIADSLRQAIELMGTGPGLL